MTCYLINKQISESMRELPPCFHTQWFLTHLLSHPEQPTNGLRCMSCPGPLPLQSSTRGKHIPSVIPETLTELLWLLSIIFLLVGVLCFGLSLARSKCGGPFPIISMAMVYLNVSYIQNRRQGLVATDSAGVTNNAKLKLKPILTKDMRRVRGIGS